jgi:hypothetical protein
MVDEVQVRQASLHSEVARDEWPHMAAAHEFRVEGPARASRLPAHAGHQRLLRSQRQVSREKAHAGGTDPVFLVGMDREAPRDARMAAEPVELDPDLRRGIRDDVFDEDGPGFLMRVGRGGCGSRLGGRRFRLGRLIHAGDRGEPRLVRRRGLFLGPLPQAEHEAAGPHSGGVKAPAEEIDE